MIKRGMNHNSPYEQSNLSKYPEELLNVIADKEYNIKDLAGRCEECRKRLDYYWRII